MARIEGYAQHLTALLDEVHKTHQPWAHKLTFRRMDQISEQPSTAANPKRVALIQRVRKLGTTFHLNGGVLRKLSNCAVRDWRDAEVLDEAWDSIGDWYS